MKYRQKPLVVEAIQFDGSHRSAEVIIKRWPTIGKAYSPEGYLRGLWIKNWIGTIEAKGGDWIVQGVKGEPYLCKPDIFAATYEPVPRADGTCPAKDPR
jgi:hypothetical protein